MKEKVRYISADLLRGLVIIIMIEVHVFNAFLIPELRQSGWFGILNFLNGLVAPSFLFVSGFAFQVSSGGKLGEMRKFGKTFWKKVMRIFQIIIIGYVLHIPIFSLTDIINKATPQQIESLLAVDVLQCIGVGLLFLFITRLIIKSDKVYNYFLIISLVVVTLISPIFWKTDFTSLLPLVIANYFNRLNGSLFPIFPWLNFLLAGAIFAKSFVDAREKKQELKFIKYSTTIGLISLVFGHLFYSGLFPNPLTSILPNPIFFFERLGYVFVLFYLCWAIDRKTNIKNSFIMDASRESLLVYWLHLVTIYGMFLGGKSLAIIIGQKLNGLEATMSAIILIVLMIIVSKTWGLLKKNYTNYVSISVKAVVVVLIIVFIIF